MYRLRTQMASSFGEKERAFIKALLEEKYDFGPVEAWTAYHFTRLSDDIQTQTKRSVSTSTLQRMLGKKSKPSAQYRPQVHTLNALAQFFGFKNWASLSQQVQTLPSPSQSQKLSVPRLLVIGIIGIGLFLLARAHFVPSPPPTLSIVNPIDTIPFTLKVQYDAKDLHTTTVLDFREGLPPVVLRPDKHIVTYYFTKAGYEAITLMQDSIRLQSYPVHRLSKGWQLSCRDNYPNARHTVLKDELSPQTDTPLYFSSDTLQTLGLPPQIDPWIFYTLSEPFALSLDSLSLDLTALNTPEIGGKSCYDIMLRLSGEKGNIEFRILDKKCQHHARVELSEQVLSGVYDDLESLAHDMSKWQHIGLRVQHRRMQISLDGKLLMEESYQQLMGPLKTIEIGFYGNGKFKNLRYHAL